MAARCLAFAPKWVVKDCHSAVACRAHLSSGMKAGVSASCPSTLKAFQGPHDNGFRKLGSSLRRHQRYFSSLPGDIACVDLLIPLYRADSTARLVSHLRISCSVPLLRDGEDGT
eukprot:c25340_g1_i1 orf=530-871(-)